MTNKEATPEFCSCFAESALQLVSRETRKKVGKVISHVSEASSDVGVLRRHMSRMDYCNKMWASSSDETVAGKGFKTMTV